MRSRYCAFVLRDERYLLATWHPARRPLQVVFAEDQPWTGLTIVDMQVMDPDSAEVEFVARSRSAGSPDIRHHERSRFVREGGVWWYVDGVLKAGRGSTARRPWRRAVTFNSGGGNHGDALGAGIVRFVEYDR